MVEDFVKLEYEMYPYKETEYRSAHVLKALHTSSKTAHAIWKEINRNKRKTAGKRMPERLSWRDMARVARKYRKQYGLKYTMSLAEEEQKVVAFRFVGLIAQNILWDYGRYHDETLDISINTDKNYDYVMYINGQPFMLIDILDNNPPEPPNPNSGKTEYEAWKDLKDAPYLYLSFTKCTEEDFYGIFKPMQREGYLYNSLKRIILNKDCGAHNESRFVTLRNGFPK